MMERTAGMLATALALALASFVCFPGCGASQPKQVENPDPLGLGAADVGSASDSVARFAPTRPQGGGTAP